MTVSAPGADGGIGIQINNSAGSRGILRFGLDSATIQKGLLYDRDSGRISLINDSNGSTITEGLTVLESGNVGIGTTSPKAKLEVSGDILVNGNTIGK